VTEPEYVKTQETIKNKKCFFNVSSSQFMDAVLSKFDELFESDSD